MKKLFPFLSLLISLNISAQEKKENISGFGLDFQIEQRLNPIYLSGFEGLITEPNILILYNADNQISGTSFLGGGFYYFSKISLYLRFMQSIRYDHLYFDTGNLTPAEGNINKSVKGFITDYHLLLEKRIFHRKNYSINMAAGYSLMNRGTEFSYTRKVGEINSSPLLWSTSGDFSMEAFHLEFSYENQGVKFSLGGYFTDEHNYNQPSELLIIYLKAGYRFHFNKDGK